MFKILRMLSFIVLLGTFLVSLNSCDKDDDPSNSNFGTVSGTVTDDSGEPIADVKVTVSGVNEEDVVVMTGADGKYSVGNVSVKLHAITFSKTGWLTVSKSVSATDFDANKSTTVDVTLQNASAKIVGTISDAKAAGAPLSGVTVTIGAAGTVTTTAEGTFAIENLVPDAYTVTFTKDNYVTITKNVTKADFVDGVVTINLTMGGQELLRGLTADDLARAEKWYYNEYRGGRNADAYPHWDWACNYMSTLDFRGAWEEQNEGTTLQIRNSTGDRSNPADLNVFDSFVFGSKRITQDNKIMSLRIRTHSADAGSPVHFGVQVVDLSAAQPAAVKIGDNKTFASENYTDFEFDLSNYVGKEVVIAIGTYRQATGDYWKQLVLRAIRFADKKVENWDWLPGNEVVTGWKLTHETARSTMPHTKKSFTGLSPQSGDRGNYVGAYRKWRDVAHIAAEWSFVPLKKDPEVFPSEGYLIKTRNTPDVSTTVPEAYLYSKFSIAAGSNKLTLSTRTFGGNYTFFKLTAIDNDGNVIHVAPQSNTAQDASAADDGCWKFKHDAGGAGTPEQYAKFVYDLSQFDGKDVTIAIGVYNGAASSGENKLVFHRIDLN
ncbi:carboxypeptidase-like regulatory domain-containing protein [Pseudochryseolinea flava]|nr:carboxypeptidase-like regulatory domain-containing protein [Pseudochryseolinea flava]